MATAMSLCVKTTAQDTIKVNIDEINVTGTRTPLPATKAVRIVQILSHKDIEESSAQSINDLLKLAAGIDVRQRGACGVQTDVGVNGGNSDQLTVLLNGINITNPHTGHLTVDLPVNPDDIERIEIIEGGASRIYGLNAFSGAINIVTRKATQNSIGANLSAGSFGTIMGNAHGALKRNNLTTNITMGMARSDGGTENSDFKKHNAFIKTDYSNKALNCNVQLGYSNINYGANTFYGTGSHSQYEETNRFLVSLEGSTNSLIVIKPMLYWNRSYDHYVWIRNNPSLYENYHQTNVYGANINAHTHWQHSSAAIGLEMRREEILSTRLGHDVSDTCAHQIPNSNAHYKYCDTRTNWSLYVEYNATLSETLNLSAGVITNKNTSMGTAIKLYPGIDISWHPTHSLRFYAAFNQSFRMPTFTDMYYNGPGLHGNEKLKPEKSTDYALGVSHTCQLSSNSLRLFFRHGTDMIDWVKEDGANIWTSDNSDIDTKGAELLSVIRFADIYGTESPLQTLTLSYCFIDQQRKHERATVYAGQLSYLRHKLVCSLSHRIVSHLSAAWDLVVRQRKGEFDNAETGETQQYGTSTQLDLKLQWFADFYTLYVQGNNLNNKKYYDVSNVPQPGIWISAGAKFNLNL